MSPREIDLHIEELVLHGFNASEKWCIGDALENELRGLLGARGIPENWQSSPSEINAGATRPFSLTSARLTGAQIAHAVYGGDTVR